MKLDWEEEEALSAIFYRAWTKEIKIKKGDDPHREVTQKELKEWMDKAERKIRGALKRIRAKQRRRRFR